MRVFLVLIGLLNVYLIQGWKSHFPPVFGRIMKGLMIPMIVLPASIQPTLANREIANIPTSGIFFKDSLRVSAFEDPKISGVTIYLSDFDRPITEKLTNNFFNDPSSSSLTCSQTGPIKLKGEVSLSGEGEEVFEESRNLFFKVISLNF